MVPGARFCFQCGVPLGGLPSGDLATERRVVTVLFGDLSEFTSWAEDLDPERVGGVTDRVLASLAQIVVEFGGHVDKLTGDGIMAVFGAPTAHEDDPERAVRAAARMQSVVRRLVEEESGGGRMLGLRVGLNSGEVVAGIQAQLSYTVVGDTVNTAARLSDAAGVGAVFAGRDTAEATRSVASWRALTPLRLKGKREPVAAYELVRLRAAEPGRQGLGDEAPLLGREAEFGQLVGRLLDALDSGVLKPLVVTGEAGVGKTRLAQEAGRFAGELPGARVLYGRCTPYGEGRDLAAVGDMVRSACGIVDSDDAETARGRVARTVNRLEQPPAGGLVPRLVTDRLCALLGLEEGAEPPPGGVPSAAAVGGQAVRQAVATLFTGLAQQGPLLLVVDDVHWASRTLLEGLLDVARQVRGGVLALVLGRPDMLDTAAGDGATPWWEALAGAELLTLAPLGERASERLLRAYLGVPDSAVDRRVREELLTRAQGNPFFLAELLHLLVDRGTLRRDGEQWVLDGDLGELTGAVLPAGVQAVLAARIDGLDGPAKGVLRDASVVGLTMGLPALEAVGRVSGHGQPDVVQRAVDVLVGRRLLEPLDGAGRYRFVHTLVRDVAYAGLAKVERARRHAAAAEHALAAGGRGSDTDRLVAQHGERAVRLAAEMGLPHGDPSWRAREVAFAALARLGRSALARDDHVTARRALGRALVLGRATYGPPLGIDLVVPVQVAHAGALVGLQRLEEAEAELGPALSAPDPAQRAEARAVLGDVRRQRGDLVGAREAFMSALSLARSVDAPRLAGEALRQLGLLDYFEGRLRAAEERFREARDLADLAEDARGAGWALQHLAWSATTRGDYALADAVLVEAAGVFEALEDRGGLSWVAGTEGFVRLLQGRFAEARRTARSVLPLGEAVGEPWGVAALLVIDALAAAELGEVEVAARGGRAGPDPVRRARRPLGPGPGADRPGHGGARGRLPRGSGRAARRGRAAGRAPAPGDRRAGARRDRLRAPRPRRPGRGRGLRVAGRRHAQRAGPRAARLARGAGAAGAGSAPSRAAGGGSDRAGRRARDRERAGAAVPAPAGPVAPRRHTARPRARRGGTRGRPAGRGHRGRGRALAGAGAAGPRFGAAGLRPARRRPRGAHHCAGGGAVDRHAGRGHHDRPAARGLSRRALPGPAGQSFGVEDRDRPRVDPHPAARGEVGQRLVDRLARGADQLRQLLLREVVVHPHAPRLRGAEALGQLEQRLGDPAGHVGEDQVGQGVVGAPQPPGQDPEQLLGDLRPVAEPRPQRAVGQ